MHSNLICIQDSICIFPYIYFQVDWEKVNLVQFYADLNIKHSCAWHLIVLLLKIFLCCLFKGFFIPAAVFTLLLVKIKKKKKNKKPQPNSTQNCRNQVLALQHCILWIQSSKLKSCCCFSSHFSIGNSICSNKPDHKQYFCLRSPTVKTRQTPNSKALQTLWTASTYRQKKELKDAVALCCCSFLLSPC